MTWWRRLLQRDRVERQLDAELRDHFERLVADYVQSGMTEPEARRRARLAFGGMEQVKEDCRDVRGTRWLDEIAQDVRYGLRILRRSPAFTLVAVASLALGIGANSAIFALVDGVLLKTLPVREPERLVLLDDGSWTNPIWEQLRDRQHEWADGAIAWSDTRFDLSRGGATEFVEGVWASGGFFEVLGVPAILGRTFSAADDQRNGGPDGPVAVISYAFWQRRFGGEAGVIGRTLTLDRVPFTIVGVTPPSFLGPSPGRSFDVAVPIGTQAIVHGPRSWLDARSTWVLEIMARLKPGQTADQATSALRAIQPQVRTATLPEGWPPPMLEQYLRDGLTLVPAAAGPAGFRTRYERPLWIIMAVVVLVLLIACANIANLMLARASGRRHELTMRLALGASRFRIARQLLVESLLLAVAGAAFGLLFAQWGSRLIVAQLSTPRSTVVLDLALDWRVVGFTALVAVGTALLFGIAPALRIRRVDPIEALKEQSRAFAGEGRRVFGSPLLVVQVACTLVLVVAAGLFMRTFGKLATLDIGLDRDAILVVDVDAARSGTGPEERLALFERIREAAAAVPGVAGAGLSLITPVSGSGWNGPIELPDRPDVPTRERMSFYNSATPGWFATMGTRLLAGRDFNERDRGGAPKVGIPNEAFVKKYVKGTPIGQTIRYETRSERDGSGRDRRGRPRCRLSGGARSHSPGAVPADGAGAWRGSSGQAEPQRSRRVRFTGAADTQRRRSHLARRSGCLADVPSSRRFHRWGARPRTPARDAVGILRRPRAPARGHRALRDDRLFGEPAQGGDWHSHGAWRTFRARRRHGAEEDCPPGLSGARRRRRSQLLGRTLCRHAALRPRRPRSADLRRRRHLPGRRQPLRCVGAGAPGRRDRSGARAA